MSIKGGKCVLEGGRGNILPPITSVAQDTFKTL